jgi:flagellar assembly protein FliH
MERLLLQVGVEMTFLSKVIKKETLNNWSVCDVNYEALLNSDLKGADSPSALDAGGFTPLFYNDHKGSGNGSRGDANGSSSEDGGISAPDIPEGMVLVSEEDLKTQLEESYERGHEEGRLVTERGLAHVFRALRDGADSLISLRDKVLRDSEGDLLKLSRMMARKIVLKEIAQDPNILLNIVAATVSCCSDQDKITIRLSPDDHRMVMANSTMLADVVGDEGRVAFAPDDCIKLGGCLVETPTGTVDARIESQLDEVYNRCMEECGIPNESFIGVDGEEQGI